MSNPFKVTLQCRVQAGLYFTCQFSFKMYWIRNGHTLFLLYNSLTLWTLIPCFPRQTKNGYNQSINQFRRPGPIWAFAISWFNLLWWRVGIDPVHFLTFNCCLSYTSERVWIETLFCVTSYKIDKFNKKGKILITVQFQCTFGACILNCIMFTPARDFLLETPWRIIIPNPKCQQSFPLILITKKGVNLSSGVLAIIYDHLFV
jgi:hypothetical protein